MLAKLRVAEAAAVRVHLPDERLDDHKRTKSPACFGNLSGGMESIGVNGSLPGDIDMGIKDTSIKWAEVSNEDIDFTDTLKASHRPTI